MQRFLSRSLQLRTLRVGQSHRLIRQFCSTIEQMKQRDRVHALLTGLKANTSNEEEFMNTLMPYLKDPQSLQVIAELLGKGGFLQTAEEMLQNCITKYEVLPILWSCSAVLKGWLESGSVQGKDIQDIIENTNVLRTLESIIQSDVSDEKRVEFVLNYLRLLTASYTSFARQLDLTPIDAYLNLSIYPPILKKYINNEYLMQQILMTLISVLPSETESAENDKAILEMTPDLVELLKLYGDGTTFAGMTLRVLTLVTLNNDGLNIEKAYECDILRLLEALCLEHLHDKNITFHVCSLIRNLTAWREGPGSNNRQLIYESKIVSLITNILRTHFSNDTLCWSGTSVLLNLCLPPPDQEYSTWLKTNGILEAVHKTMKQHKEEARVIQNCCGIMMGMGYFNLDVQNTLLEMQVAEFLVHETKFVEDPKVAKFLEWLQSIYEIHSQMH